jgi:hypothetical protein
MRHAPTQADIDAARAEAKACPNHPTRLGVACLMSRNGHGPALCVDCAIQGMRDRGAFCGCPDGEAMERRMIEQSVAEYRACMGWAE